MIANITVNKPAIRAIAEILLWTMSFPTLLTSGLSAGCNGRFRVPFFRAVRDPQNAHARPAHPLVHGHEIVQPVQERAGLLSMQERLELLPRGGIIRLPEDASRSRKNLVRPAVAERRDVEARSLKIAPPHFVELHLQRHAETRDTGIKLFPPHGVPEGRSLHLFDLHFGSYGAQGALYDRSDGCTQLVPRRDLQREREFGPIALKHAVAIAVAPPLFPQQFGGRFRIERKRTQAV